MRLNGSRRGDERRLRILERRARMPRRTDDHARAPLRDTAADGARRLLRLVHAPGFDHRVCLATRADGKQCRAMAERNREFCAAHRQT